MMIRCGDGKIPAAFGEMVWVHGERVSGHGVIVEVRPETANNYAYIRVRMDADLGYGDEPRMVHPNAVEAVGF